MATMSWSETGSLPEGMDGNVLLPIERGPWAGQVFSPILKKKTTLMEMLQ